MKRTPTEFELAQLIQARKDGKPRHNSNLPPVKEQPVSNTAILILLGVFAATYIFVRCT